MAGRTGSRVQTFLGFFGVVALAVSAALLTGVNPADYTGDTVSRFLRNLTGPMSEPEPRWRQRVDGPPVAAVVESDHVVVLLNGAVEVRRLADGGEAWTRTVDWAVPAGDAVVAGRSDGGGFEVLDLATGEVRWQDLRADDVWPYQNMVLSTSCGRAECTLHARSTTNGTVKWGHRLDGAGHRLAGYPELKAVVDRAGLLPPGHPGPAPRLVGVVSDRTVTIVDSRTGARLGQLPDDAHSRVTAVEDRLIGVSSREAAEGRCRQLVRAWDATGGEVWRRAGYDLGTVSGYSCEPREDPLASRGLLPAVGPNDRPALLRVRDGGVRWLGGTGATLLGTDGRVALVRPPGGGPVTALDADTGAELWRRTVNQQATVLVTAHAVVITDPEPGTVLAVSPTTGDTLRRWRSGASVIGIDEAGLVLASGRTVGYAVW